MTTCPGEKELVGGGESAVYLVVDGCATHLLKCSCWSVEMVVCNVVEVVFVFCFIRFVSDTHLFREFRLF